MLTVIEIDWYGAQWNVPHLHSSEVPSLISWTREPLARCRAWDSRDWYEFGC